MVRVITLLALIMVKLSSLGAMVWNDLKTNSNGKVVVAISSLTGILISRDGGSTWQQASVPRLPWKAISLSTNGQTVIAAGSTPGLYLSAQNESSWNKLLPIQDDAQRAIAWRSVSLSSSGQYIFACTEDAIYRSTDFGSRWRPTLSLSGDWQAISTDSTGRYAVAIGLQEGIYLSGDFGANWEPSKAPVSSWIDLACSSSGKRCVAVTIADGVYVSDDHGRSWTVTTAPSLAWTSVSCNLAGRVIVASSHEGIYYQTAYSKDWQKFWLPTKKWSQVAMAGDTSLLFAVADGDPTMAFSTDFGKEWKVIEQKAFVEYQDVFIRQREALERKFKTEMLDVASAADNKQAASPQYLLSPEERKKQKIIEIRRQRKVISQGRLESQWKPRKESSPNV